MRPRNRLISLAVPIPKIVVTVFIALVAVPESRRSRALGAVPLSISDVVAMERQHVSQIRTLDIYFTQEQVGFDQSLHPTQSGRIVLSGNRFRAETGLDLSSSTPRYLASGEIRACDLKNDQQFYMRTRELRVGSPETFNGPYPQDLPILFPFRPVVASSAMDRTWRELKFGDAVWKELSRSGAIMGRRDYAGHPCTTMAIRRDGKVEYLWYLATDLQLYPIGYETLDRNGATVERFVVNEVKTFDDGHVLIPLSSTMTYYSPSGPTTGHFMFNIVGSTVRVNQPVADADFTIDPALASKYMDLEHPDRDWGGDGEPSKAGRPEGVPCTSTSDETAGRN